MAFNIISGRSKSGKSKYIYDKILKLLKNGKEVILIVPEQYTHAAERRLLETVNAIKDNQVEVFSFMHLASITDKRLGFPDIEKINPVGKALIVDNILKNGDYEYFKSVCLQNGFVDLCVKTVGEFKKYMLVPDILSDTAKKTDDEVLSMKLRDLSQIYGEYEKAISQKYSDSDDALTLLAKRLTESNIYKDKYIFLDEFSTFVPQELCVISALEKQCKEMYVSLCYDKNEKNSALFMPAFDTYKSLKKVVSGEVKFINIENTYFKSNDLKYLENNLYKFPAKKYDGKCNDISILSANNPCSETEQAAVEILKLVRKNSFRFNEIGIICSDITVYDRHIERIFSDYKIPYFIDVKSDVLNHNLVRFILNLLDVYLNDYSYESIFNYLKTAFTGANPEHISVLENYIQRTNIRKNAWLSDEKWDNLLNNYYKDNEKTQDILNNIRNTFVLPLAKMHEKIKGRHSVTDDVKALYELITELNLPATIEKYIEKFNNEGESRLCEEYKQIWEIIVESFDQIVYICKDKLTNVSDFRNLLYTAFSQYQIGYIPSAVDGVIVGNTERTRVDNLKVLFVLGVNEGVFPVAPKKDGVLSDRDKDEMKNMGIEFSTTSVIAAYYSQFAIYRAFTMPSDKLFISYSKTGNDFKTLRKSYIISRVSKLLNIKEESESNNELWKISTVKVCKQHLAENMALYGKTGNVDSIWRNVYEYFDKYSDFTSKLNIFSAAVNIPEKINQERLKELTGDNDYTSVSRIQRYMACHYSYFMDYILNVNEKKTQVVDSLDIGNITHSILERICRRIEESEMGFKNADDEYIALQIDEMLNEYLSQFTKFNDELSKRNAYIIKRLKGSIFICIKAIQNHIVNSMFEPLGYEMEFKDDSDLGCIKIDLENGKQINLTGKIDRADAYKTKDGTFVRVIDYKTGSKSFKLDDILYGLDIQLVVYLNALVKSNSEYNYGGALYFLIDDPIVKAKGNLSDDKISEKLETALKLKGMIVKDEVVLSGYDKKTAAIKSKFDIEKFNLMNLYIEKLLKNVCTSMTQGDISINPYKKGGKCPCDYCKYLPVCRFDTTNKNNSYNYLESLDKADEIWTKMEAKLDVD